MLSSYPRYVAPDPPSLTIWSNFRKQHPARDLQDTFYVSDPLKAARPGPESGDDKQDYEEYFQNVRQVHENGKYGSIGYRYPWAEEESLRCVVMPLYLVASG